MTHARIASSCLLLAALGCGDSTADPPADGSSGDSTGTTPGTTTTLDTSGDTTTGSPPGSSSDTAPDSSDGTTTAGVGPEIEVSVEARPVASGGSVALPPVGVSAVGETVVVTIENAGSETLELGAITLDQGATAHFALDDTGVEAMVAPGASTSVSVTFDPSNGGRKSAQLAIESNDADEATYLVTLDARTPANTYRLLQPATPPSVRFNAAIAGTGDGRVLMFGGRGSDGARLSDTWLLDPEAGEWTELSPPVSPSARDSHSMATAGAGAVLLFGGNFTNGPMPTPLDDTWVFDLAAETWTELLPPEAPPSRYQHALVPVGDGMVMAFGGRAGFGLEYDDTWVFDLAAETWADLAPATSPGTRSAFSMAFDGDDTVLLVGGTNDSVIISDQTWAYRVGANDWEPLAVAGQGEHFNAAGAWVEGVFVSHGGKGTCCTEPVAVTWAYDPGADAWSDISPMTQPVPRFSHTMEAVGPDKAIIFGGLLMNANNESATAQTWEYVGP